MKEQDEIVGSYIEKLEQENKDLKGKIKNMSKKELYLFERGWWYDNGAGLFWLIILLAAMSGAGTLIWKGIHYTDTGRFYVDSRYNQNTRKYSYCVNHEFDWAEDDTIDCFDKSDDAHNIALEERAKWVEQDIANGEIKCPNEVQSKSKEAGQ